MSVIRSATSFKHVPATEVQRLRAALADAPATARVVVRPVKAGTRTHYAPFLEGHRLSRLFGGRVEAEDQANVLQKRLDELRGRRERPCMTCRRPFLSAGHHNRLCDYCRSHANDAGMW